MRYALGVVCWSLLGIYGWGGLALKMWIDCPKGIAGLQETERMARIHEIVRIVYSLVGDRRNDPLHNQAFGSAISIPSNIAEGSGEMTKRAFRHHLNIAYASGSELSTQLILINRLDRDIIHK
jgi:four helix bundle protein